MEQLMKHEIESIITKNDINMPDFWDVEKVITAFRTLDSFELYEYFGCKNRTSFTRMMKEVFPEREEKTSYSKYVKNLFSDFDIAPNVMKHVPEIVTEIVSTTATEIVSTTATEIVSTTATEIVPEHVLPEGRNFSDAQIMDSFSLSNRDQQVFLKKCSDLDYKVWKTFKN